MGERFLQGRTALVTGSTSGIGLAIAQALGSAGARVAVNGLGSHEQVEAAVASVCQAGAPDATFLGADLSDAAAIESMMQALSDWGPADIVVNCAGVQHTAPIGEMPAATWDKLIAINLSAAFHTMRLALPGMVGRGFGRVLNIASVHGLVASVNKSPYVASKFGLVGLSKVAALEVAGAGSRDSGGVTVNCVCPGWVETPLIEPQIAARAQASGGDRDAGIRALLSEKQPSGRLSLPADIAATVLFLCRQEAHNITGTAIPVDGGWTSQ
ncbi:MAG TPA: 3-hydroxybutyrate dehydrogenase [Arenimonas sp.]